MRMFLLPLLTFVISSSAYAQDAHSFLSKSVAAMTLAKGEFSSHSVTLRTAKTHGVAHGHDVLLWAECTVKIESTVFGLVNLVSVKHRGAYQWRSAKFELPSDILSAHAQSKGVFNRLGIAWYQGTKANLPKDHYTTLIRQAAGAVKNVKKMKATRSEFSFNSSDNQSNNKSASRALKYIGGVEGLNNLLRVCGTPQGLDLRNIDMNMLLY